MAEIKASKVEYVSVTALVADPRNVKQHPDAQVRQIAASISAYGFNDPIGVDQDNVVVEGHGRLMAAQHLGLSEVPCIRLQFTSDEERKAYAIAHNQVQTLSPMDNRNLAREVERLGIDEGMYQSVGLTSDDIVFLDFEDRQRRSDADGGSAARFSAGRVPRTVIAFDGQEQVIDWYNFLDWLREQFPETLTIADRLDMFMQVYGEAIHDF